MATGRGGSRQGQARATRLVGPGRQTPTTLLLHPLTAQMICAFTNSKQKDLRELAPSNYSTILSWIAQFRNPGFFAFSAFFFLRPARRQTRPTPPRNHPRREVGPRALAKSALAGENTVAR